MKREFLQQCQKYTSQLLYAWMSSEKFDGVRVHWDGGIHRGQYTSYDPGRKATGLWTRYCKVVTAPDWLLDMLPPYPLDGEFWIGYGKFQETVSIVTRHEPDDRWKQIKYMVFTIPDVGKIFAPGLYEYRIGNKKHSILFKDKFEGDKRTFIEKYRFLDEHLPRTDNLDLVHQIEVPRILYIKSWIDGMLSTVLEVGGEGLVFQNPHAQYQCERTWDCLKYKPYDDDEGVVVGTMPGEGKYEGMIGSLVIEWKGHRFCVSGLTDIQRQQQWPVGKVITFRYRGFTDEGLPREARFKGERTC